MSYRLLSSVAASVVVTLQAAPLHAQAANPDCKTSGNPLDCITTPQSQLAASLEAILTQRIADKPAARETWSRATSDQARIAVQDARANYNAMTAMVQRLVDASAPWAQPELNADLKLDFSLLADVEARYEEDNPATGRRRDALTRMSVAPGAGGAETFRLEEDGEIFVKQQKVWTYRSRMQYQPGASLFYQTEETIPISPAAPPAYEAAALVGGDAFVAPMPPKRRFETKVAPGAIYPTMLGLVISAMAGELPPSFTIWIVNEQGEVIPAEVRVIGELTVEEPVGPADGSCAGVTGTNQPRRAVELQVSAGTLSHTRIVLADAPHLKVSDGLKCRVVRGAAGPSLSMGR